MKYKLLAMLMTAFLLIVPMIGFWHPPPPPPGYECPFLGTLVNGEKQWNFTEPVDGYCEDFVVTAYVFNVTDMYGYEINITYNNVYFNFVSIDVKTIWAAQSTIVSKNNPALGLYELVVTALPPSTGVTGDFIVAELTFHIMNDVCNCDTMIPFVFGIIGKLSNSCSGIIDQCQPIPGGGFFIPSIPYLWIEPVELTSSIVGEKNTITVMLKDIVKMTDFNITIFWDQYLHLFDPCGFVEGPWSTLLTTTKAEVVVNTALFEDAVIEVSSPVCGWYNLTNQVGFVNVAANTIDLALLNLTYPSETVWLFKVTFTKCDPWYSGAQPQYEIDTILHEYVVEKACTPIYFGDYGDATTDGTVFISGMCDYSCLNMTGATYCFEPIPGDLDGSGHVDIADLMILAQYYGLAPGCLLPIWAPPNGFPIFYDLNADGFIDIYDIVVVAKNFCRTTP